MKYKLLLSVFFAGVLFTSCDKNFESINTDPEHLTGANVNFIYLFTSAELVTSGNSDANSYEDWRNNLIYGSTMVQHLSSTFGYWGGDKYTYNSGYNSAYWDNNYNNSIKNIVEVVENTKTDPTQVNFYNIARIFKVFMFQRMTDMYGDIPYSEAGLGYIKGITSPKYDKQQDIYADMLNELQDAASKLDAAAPNTVNASDALYGGDVTLWKKFAYSEMLRLAMRMSKVDAGQAEQWAKTAVAGGVFTSTDDDAILSHQSFVPGTPTINGNAWVLAGVDPNAARLSETFVNYLKSTADPRLSYYGTVATDPNNVDDLGDNTASLQKGQPNGYDNAGGAHDITLAPGYPGSQADYSIVNRNTFARYDAPTFFLTYAETALLEAEAAQRTWISGDPAAFYTAGVTAAMQQFDQIASRVQATPAPLTGISAGAITTYLAANPYNPADALNQINTQYWVATFLDEYEAWANWRRSGFPALVPVPPYPGNVTNGQIPRRFTYPISEPITNAANYQAAVSDLDNGDKMNSHVWWDKP
ncbi:MAG: SusD/RagB family nutrient-binding outer membrane lipoprotein [Bacteroidetes bacterium]|nr:SusD/RagB family nutrient-binding outer membrane lipoprotein [Bacteroidota bacterium]